MENLRHQPEPVGCENLWLSNSEATS
jgi:hypothetical protein